MEITFGVCGTAGRNEDGRRLSKEHFEAMCVVTNELINTCAELNYKITTLVSGASAWADHSCVKLFLDKKVPRLRLFLPTEFDRGSFKDIGVKDPTLNPGGTMNYYHKKFQVATHINSLSQIQIARVEGAELIPIAGGLYARNAMVARSDFLLAITFGNGSQVKANSGSAHCVKCYLDRVKKTGMFDKSFHYDLNEGKIYEGCTLPPKKEHAFLDTRTRAVVSNFLGKHVPSWKKP